MTVGSPCLKKIFFSGFLYFPFCLKTTWEGLVFISSFKAPHPTSWKVRKAQGWNKSVRGFSSCETHPDGGRSWGRGHMQDTASPGCFHLCMKIGTTLHPAPSCARRFTRTSLSIIAIILKPINGMSKGLNNMLKNTHLPSSSQEWNQPLIPKAKIFQLTHPSLLHTLLLFTQTRLSG